MDCGAPGGDKRVIDKQRWEVATFLLRTPTVAPGPLLQPGYSVTPAPLPSTCAWQDTWHRAPRTAGFLPSSETSADASEKEAVNILLDTGSILSSLLISDDHTALSFLSKVKNSFPLTTH